MLKIPLIIQIYCVDIYRVNRTADNTRKTNLNVAVILFVLSISTAFIHGFYDSPAAIILIATALLVWQAIGFFVKNIASGLISKSIFSTLTVALISLTILNSTNPTNSQAVILAVIYSFLSIYCLSIEKNKIYFYSFTVLVISACSLSMLVVIKVQNDETISALIVFVLLGFGLLTRYHYLPLLEDMEIAINRAEVMTTITKFSREIHSRNPEESIKNIVTVTKQLGYISAAIVSFDRRSKIVEDGVTIEDLLLYAEKASSLRRVIIETKYSDASSKHSKKKKHNDIAAAPIWFNSRYSAALIVQSDTNRKISSNDSVALELLADQAGRALENAAKTANDRRAVERLLDESHRDKLTNLGNRRYADMMISSMEPGDVLAMIDIDGLKGTNDRFGHDAGDQLLKSVGLFLEEQVRNPDLCARLGGDEFIILLKNAQPGAEQILSRLIKMWEKKAIFETTFSIGMSVHTNGQEVSETIKLADSALYQAKRTGKNRLITSN